MILQRQENETYLDFAFKVVDCVKTKSISYTEMGDLLLQEENVYSQDNLRKAFYVLDKILNKVKSDTTNCSVEEVEILERRIEELKAERAKTLTVNIERNAYDRVEARRGLFYEQVKDAMLSLPMPDFKPLYSHDPFKTGNKAYVLPISDIHYGAEFKSINNEYSPKICEERFQRLLESTIDYVEELHIEKLTVLFLGDAIQGILRMSDIKMNAVSIPRATVEISRIIAHFLNELSAYVEIEYYHVPTSNHTQIRPIGSKAGELASEDMEFIIGNYISDLLVNNERVKVNLNFESDYVRIPILGFEAIATHGHNLKSIDNAIKDLSMLHRTLFDFLFLGHFHNIKELGSGESDLSDIETLVSPSFVGSCPYADKIMKGGKAACKLYGFDEVDGHVSSYKILLG